MIEGETSNTRHRNLITYYLRNIKQSCFKSSCSAGYKSHRRMEKQRIGRILHTTNNRRFNTFLFSISQYFVIKLILNTWCTSKNNLIAFGKMTCSLNHSRKIIFYLLLSTTCQKCYNWFVRM